MDQRRDEEDRKKQGLQIEDSIVKHEDITDRIIAAFYHVYNTLGWGFLESVYHRALLHELRKRGLNVQLKAKVEVFYDGLRVGVYFADLVVSEAVIIELKAIDQLTAAHEAQLINYLRATNIEVGLLLNFGMKPQIKRKVFDSDKKTALPKSTAIVTSDSST